MKKTAIIFILLVSLIIFISIGSFNLLSHYYNSQPFDANGFKPQLANELTMKYKSITSLNILRVQNYQNYYFVVYHFICPPGTKLDTTFEPVNPNVPINVVGMCKVTVNSKNNYEIKANSISLLEGYFAYVPITDQKLGITAIGGKTRHSIIKQFQVKFMNGSLISTRPDTKGSFILIYETNKYNENKSKNYTVWLESIDQIQGVDESNKVIGKTKFYH